MATIFSAFFDLEGDHMFPVAFSLLFRLFEPPDEKEEEEWITVSAGVSAVM